MKNSNDTIGDRTRDLPACSAVPQPTAPRRAPVVRTIHYNFSSPFLKFMDLKLMLTLLTIFPASASFLFTLRHVRF